MGLTLKCHCSVSEEKTGRTSEPVVVAAHGMGDLQLLDTLGVNWEKAQKESAVL